MQRKVLILEDNKVHMNALYTILEELQSDLIIYCASDTDTAYTIAMNQHIHLFLVDIILNSKKPGDIAGLKFVQEIRNIKKYEFVPVIFVTSLEDPKLYSFSQLHCFDYIEKPFSVTRVREVVSKALRFPLQESENKFVYFRKDGIVYSKSVKEIIYIEISRRKIIVHCANDELEIPYRTHDEIMAELDSDLFVRCSRYIIANRRYIEEIDYVNRYMRLKNISEPVEIGIILKKELKNKLKNG